MAIFKRRYIFQTIILGIQPLVFGSVAFHFHDDGRKGKLPIHHHSHPQSRLLQPDVLQPATRGVVVHVVLHHRHTPSRCLDLRWYTPWKSWPFPRHASWCICIYIHPQFWENGLYKAVCYQLEATAVFNLGNGFSSSNKKHLHEDFVSKRFV